MEFSINFCGKSYLKYLCSCSNWTRNSQIFSIKIVKYKISFLTTHQAHNTIFSGQFCHCRIHKHQLPKNDLWRKCIFQLKNYCTRNLCTKYLKVQNTWKLERLNRYLEIRNGLQSVCSPLIHVTRSVQKIIFQSIISLFYIWILRPTRWDRLWWQVQILTNQIDFHSLIS